MSKYIFSGSWIAIKLFRIPQYVYLCQHQINKVITTYLHNCHIDNCKDLCKSSVTSYHSHLYKASALDQAIAGFWCHLQIAPYRKPDLVVQIVSNHVHPHLGMGMDQGWICQVPPKWESTGACFFNQCLASVLHLSIANQCFEFWVLLLFSGSPIHFQGGLEKRDESCWCLARVSWPCCAIEFWLGH